MKKSFVQFFRFSVIGVLGFFADVFFLYFAIYALDFGRISASFFSFPFAVTFTWLGNRYFTFRDAERTPLFSQWRQFVMVCAIGIVFNRGAYAISVESIPLVYDYPFIGVIIGTLAAMLFNFFVSKKFVFKA
ncbi:MAG: GtrA family protein [Alphaproteobacteria bacterium]|nr:GtrA family protein [Alphaproteobacteria bacterium]